MSEAFTPADAQGICDMAGISTKSYRMLFNKVKEGFNSKLGKKIVIHISKPFHVNKAQNILNLEMVKLVGEPCHVSSTLTMMRGTENHRAYRVKQFHYRCSKITNGNVKFYDILVHECNGRLKFVLKLKGFDL